MSQTDYPENYDRLRGLMRTLRKEAPGPMSGFAQLHQGAMADGAADAAAGEHTEVGDLIVVGSGRPCLFIPYIGAHETLGKRILVGWNGRREAVRAVHDALPILQSAEHVTIMSVHPPAQRDTGGNRLCMELCHHLARHNIMAATTSSTSAAIDAESLLLSYAASHGIDLIVMGAYGHSRLTEMVLGGVTKTMLRHMTVPVLMSN